MLYLQSEYIQKISPPGRDKLKAIILAGGSGSRLWPLSNDETPKQLLAINSEYTLLQNTFRRLLKLTDAKNILTVTNHKFHEKTRCQLLQLASDSCILSEPCARNTAPAICCALEYCLKSGGDDIAVIVPADHLIKETDKFCQSIIEAAQAAEKGYIATVGIAPSYPETGFGYIKTSGKVAENIFKVEKFTEKPPLEIAQQYAASGNYYWNGGIFIGKISVFLEEFSRFAPEISALAKQCRFGDDTIDGKIFEQMPKISIDYAIMEKSDRIVMAKLLSDWSDLGSWQAIYDISEKDENGNCVIGKAILHNVRNSLIYSPERLLAVADVENRVLVNSKEVTMSCDLCASQNVKELYEKSR